MFVEYKEAEEDCEEDEGVVGVACGHGVVDGEGVFCEEVGLGLCCGGCGFGGGVC